MKHYYLVSSLPELTLGEPPPFSSDALRDRFQSLLNKRELRELELFLAGRETEAESEFARRWRAADTQLRNAAARSRAVKCGVEPHGFLKTHVGFDVFVEKAVADAFAKTNPLERELALDRLRWRLLDDFTREDPFAFSVLTAFVIRLRIVERWAGLKEELGRRAVARTLKTLTEGLDLRL